MWIWLQSLFISFGLHDVRHHCVSECKGSQVRNSVIFKHFPLQVYMYRLQIIFSKDNSAAHLLNCHSGTDNVNSYQLLSGLSNVQKAFPLKKFTVIPILSESCHLQGLWHRTCKYFPQSFIFAIRFLKGLVPREPHIFENVSDVVCKINVIVAKWQRQERQNFAM